MLFTEFKHPESREWIDAIAYYQKENSKSYVREKKEFYKLFKRVDIRMRIIMFKSKTCGPCKTLEPIVDEIVKDGINIEKLDAFESIELVKKYGIRSVPTIVLVKDDNIRSLIGLQSKKDILSFIESVE